MKSRLLIYISLFVAFQNLLFSQWESIDIEILGNDFTVSNDTILEVRGNIVYRTTNNGDNPTEKIRLDSIMRTWGTSIAMKGSHYFVGTGSDGLFVTHDYGKTWKKVDIKWGAVVNCEIRFIAINDNALYMSTVAGPFKSTDNGDNWVELIQDPLTLYNLITSMVFKDNKIFVSTMGHPVLLSSDKGLTWINVSKDLIDNLGFRPHIYSMAVINSIILAPFHKYLFLSIDDGEHWQKKTLTNGREIYRVYSCGKNIFATCDTTGVLFSSNMGDDWILFNKGIDSGHTGGIIGFNDKYIFLKTSKLYRARLSNCEIVTTGIQENIEDNTPALSPNPAADFITINCNEQASPFPRAIEIYNVLGEKVYSNPGAEQACRFPSTIDISGFIPGVYFISYNTQDGRKVEKFVVGR